MSKRMPLFRRKIKKPDGETDEVLIGSHAVTLIVLIVVSVLTAVLLLAGVDPSALLKIVRNASVSLP